MRRVRSEVDDGETVIRAVVKARLLGLRILSLDARVVVGRPGRDFDVREPLTAALAPPPRPTLVPRDGEPVADLASAIDLLARGAATLERTRRLSGRRAIG